MESYYIDTLVIIFLVFCSALFSSSETALISSKKYKIRKLVEDGVKNAEKLEFLSENIDETISTILIGNNVVNIASTSVSTALFLELLGSKGVLFSTVLMTVVVLLFGEIVPKTLANKNPESFALKIAPVIWILSKILKPLVKVISRVINVFDKNDNEDKMTEDDLISILNVSHEDGVLENEEKDMIENVVEFTDTQAKEIMTPRTQIFALPVDIEISDLVDKIKETSFSRIPIYQDTIDDIIGVLYVRDLVGIDLENVNLRQILREPIFHYESKSNLQLLADLKKTKTTISIILDEYGGTAGILTIEDIVEEIVGDIDDEYDEENLSIKKITENTYLVDGDVYLDEINDKLNTNIDSDDYETIGGFVVGLADKFPINGEKFSYQNLEFYIQSAEPTRIKKLRLKIKGE